MVRRLVSTGLLVGCLACEPPKPPPPKDLVTAALILRDMMSEANLDRAGFLKAFPDAKPSDFVRFIGSEQGNVLWPPREESPFADEDEIALSRARGETLIPRGIAFRRGSPDPNQSRQIVYRADEARGEVVVEGYLAPDAEPVLVYRWRLPQSR